MSHKKALFTKSKSVPLEENVCSKRQYLSEDETTQDNEVGNKNQISRKKRRIDEIITSIQPIVGTGNQYKKRIEKLTYILYNTTY